MAAVGTAGLVVGGVVVLNSATGAASVIDVPVQADTYVSAKDATVGYDTASSIWLSARESNQRTGYLQFVVPAGKPVEHAELILTRDVHHFPATTVSVQQVTEEWPSVLSYRTRPSSGPAIAGKALDPGARSVSLDLSKAVTAPGVYTFSITTAVTGDAVRFLSRDSGSPELPRLRLTLGDSAPEVPVPVPTATATATPPATVPPTTTKPPTATPKPTRSSPAPTTPPATTKPPSPGCTVSRILVPTCGVWFGAAASALTEVPRDQAFADFEQRLGGPVDVPHTYHVDGNLFPNAIEKKWATDPANPRKLLINWKPTFGRSWAKVAAGDAYVDAQIDKQAEYINANFSQKFFLSIFHEPENDVDATAGSGYTAQDYKAMYRHVALRLRAKGVDNAVLVMNYMGAPKWGVAPWFDELYPGDDVVDWVSYDPYATAYAGYKSGDFAEMVNRGQTKNWPGMYNYLTKNHPGKPIMLSEWGVADDSSSPQVKPGFFDEVSTQVAKFPALKALIYFDSPRALAGDTRTNSTAASQRAFNDMVSEKIFTSLP